MSMSADTESPDAGVGDELTSKDYYFDSYSHFGIYHTIISTSIMYPHKLSCTYDAYVHGLNVHRNCREGAHLVNGFVGANIFELIFQWG